MQRHRQAELMDDPGVDPAAHRAALHALRRVNRWLGVEQRLVRVIAQTVGPRPARILDIGTGGGGFLECAARHAGRNGASWQVLALDRSPFALAEARSALARGNGRSSANHRFLAADALRLPFPDRCFDVVACSLLLHHFDPADAVGLLREAARVCGELLIIGDLDRSRMAWLATALVTRITSRARIFHVDGPRSVRAAYRPAEARTLAAQAGLDGCRVDSVFPFRWLLRWQRSRP